MRRYILAGNWKMNLDAEASAQLVKDLIPLVKDATDVDVVVGPVFTSIPAAVQAACCTNIAVAAQNCYGEESGAFTGAISPPMLKAAGVTYCIIGHSERRQFFGETDEGINKKARALYAELHQCDELGAEVVLVETLPEGEAWEALRDRLRRAAAEGQMTNDERNPNSEARNPKEVRNPNTEL